MLCMVFGQLTSRDSMRDLMLSLEAHKPKYYHLGFGPTISRRNFGKANEKRSYKIFEEFAYVLIEAIQIGGVHSGQILLGDSRVVLGDKFP